MVEALAALSVVIAQGYGCVGSGFKGVIGVTPEVGAAIRYPLAVIAPAAICLVDTEIVGVRFVVDVVVIGKLLRVAMPARNNGQAEVGHGVYRVGVDGVDRTPAGVSGIGIAWVPKTATGQVQARHGIASVQVIAEYVHGVALLCCLVVAGAVASVECRLDLPSPPFRPLPSRSVPSRVDIGGPRHLRPSSLPCSMRSLAHAFYFLRGLAATKLRPYPNGRGDSLGTRPSMPTAMGSVRSLYVAVLEEAPSLLSKL